MDETFAGIDWASEAEPNPAARPRAALRRGLELFAADPPAARLLNVEILAAGAAGARAQHEAIGQLAERLGITTGRAGDWWRLPAPSSPAGSWLGKPRRFPSSRASLRRLSWRPRRLYREGSRGRRLSVTRSNFAARPGRGGGADVNYEDRLAEALLDLCFERGYRNLNLPALLERAALDEAAFHRRFDDLEDCFVSVLEELSGEFLVAVAAAAGSEEAWRAQIRAVAYRILRFLKEDERRAHFLFVESPKGGDRAQLIRDRGLEAMFDLIDRGRAELADPESISRATSEALAGTIFNQIQIAIEQQALDAVAVPPLMYAVVLPYVGVEVAAEELSISAPEDGR